LRCISPGFSGLSIEKRVCEMVKSMTGYGRGERAFDGGVQITVELRSVNNRYLDCAVKMPRAYIFAEDAMKRLASAGAQVYRTDELSDIMITVADGGYTVAHPNGEAL